MIQENDIYLLAIFIFYNTSGGIQSSLSFSKEFKHCGIVTFDGNHWIATDFDETGLLTRYCTIKRGARFLELMKHQDNVSALISCQITERFKIKWKPFLARSCNEICRYVAGIDVGFTFNPIHLYKKLLKYDRRRNYEILSHWRRSDGVSETTPSERSDIDSDQPTNPTEPA